MPMGGKLDRLPYHEQSRDEARRKRHELHELTISEQRAFRGVPCRENAKQGESSNHHLCHLRHR